MASQVITLDALQGQLPEAVERAHDLFDRFVITHRGRAEAVLLSVEELEGLLETLEILSNPELVRELALASQELHEGGGEPLADVLQAIESDEDRSLD